MTRHGQERPAYYTIEIISERLRIPTAAIRRYTRLGFVAPSARHGRTVLYSEADVARLRKVVRLTRDLGLNYAGVEVTLRLIDQMDALRRELAALREEER
jgi:MerR family transcriptional regulator, heat shock protein HspR